MPAALTVARNWSSTASACAGAAIPITTARLDSVRRSLIIPRSSQSGDRCASLWPLCPRPGSKRQIVNPEHLGEVADHLIGHFVDQARRSGASWTDIGKSMGVTKQASQKRFVLRAETTTLDPNGGLE